ncbi:hypothetical protein Tco_1406836 [Tanacetum coccineum]
MIDVIKMEIKDQAYIDPKWSPVDAMKYRSMIGALVYLTSSRPDIVHATCLCARIRRRCCSLILAESRIKTSCSIDKDKYMMKAQARVSKSSAISDVQALPQKNIFDKFPDTNKDIFYNFQDIKIGCGDTKKQCGIKDSRIRFSDSTNNFRAHIGHGLRTGMELYEIESPVAVGEPKKASHRGTQVYREVVMVPEFSEEIDNKQSLSSIQEKSNFLLREDDSHDGIYMDDSPSLVKHIQKTMKGLVVPLFVTMPAQRSNEDQAVRISKSIFVTNFPYNLGRKELWKVIRVTILIVGLEIFVDLDWLVFHLHAIDFPPLIASVAPVSSSPALVFDDSCVVERDLSCHVMGRVKDINSIPNLRILLAKEGFEHVKLSYLGGLWVLIELDNEGSKQKFLDHVSYFMFGLEKRLPTIGNKWGEALDIEDNFGSSFARKRLCILTKQPESILEKFKISDARPDDECNVDGVSETVFSDNVDECNVDGHGKETDKQQLEDPFGFYDLLNKLPAKGFHDAVLLCILLV